MARKATPQPQGILAADGAVVIRSMRAEETDFQQYLQWMTDPETMKYWEGMTVRFTYERVVEEYRENLREQVWPCFIEYEGRAVGYCQFCTLDAAYFEIPQAGYDAFAGPEDAVFGIDMFLGETALRGRGLGTRTLKLLLHALFDRYGADAVMIDTKTHNTRALRCYRKAGFQDLFVVPSRELQDGVYHDSLIMGIRKKDAFV